MTLVKTYAPDAVKLTVGDTLVQGYDESVKNFIEGSEEFFSINLHFGSPSIQKLRQMMQPNRLPTVKFEAGITSSAFVDGEYLTSETTHKHLDFSGKYCIDGPHFKYSLDGIKVSFNFQKQI